MTTAPAPEHGHDWLRNLDVTFTWRREQLEAAGYDYGDAIALARRGDVDLHLACELVGRGCDSLTARSILL